MLRLANREDLFDDVVEVTVPGAEKPHAFRVKWALVDSDAKVNAMLAKGQATLLRAVLRDWDDVFAEDGAPVPFSDEARDRLLDVPYVRRAAADAYVRFVAGLPSKNSYPSRSDSGAAETEH